MNGEALNTRFTRLIGCELPIQLAAMGGVSTPELAAAVSGAGGLGMLHHRAQPALREAITRVMETAPARPFGVGFFGFMVDADRENFELAADRARVVEIFWEWPRSDWVDAIHAGGALALWQAGSAEEAMAAEEAGCDAVVLQGIEAGGHVRGTTPLLRLLKETVPRLSVPAVAAGAIVDGRSMAAAMAGGADAVRMGTRFVATRESAAHPDYLEALCGADGEDTVLTNAFEVGWPDAPHRVLHGSLQAAQAFEGDVVATGDVGGDTLEVTRFSPMPPTRGMSGEIAATVMYAGQGVGGVDDVPAAADLVKRIAAEAGRLL